MNRILLVEDEENISLLYRSELEADGYEVLVEKDGKNAVKKAIEEEPDLVIMDINLPAQMDGLEAMSKIQASGKAIPVIINTSYSHYKDNFLAWAADEYIIKSADLSELKSAIRRVLKKTRQSKYA